MPFASWIARQVRALSSLARENEKNLLNQARETHPIFSFFVQFSVLTRFNLETNYGTLAFHVLKLIWHDDVSILIPVYASLSQRFAHNGETPTADAAKLYWMFLRIKQPAILGALMTVVVYTLLFVISSLILYLYCLRYGASSTMLFGF